MNNKKGFTLVEVIISIAALSIICVVLLRLFVLAGNTNKTAGEKQDAEIAVVSCVESLLSADSIESGLVAHGAVKPISKTKGRYDFEQNGYTIVIEYEEEEGEYPGTLYSICIKALKGGNTMSVISTKKYDKEQHGG